MKINKLVVSSLVCAFALNTATAETFDVVKLDDARVFAEFTDELPAVVNYYTKASKQEIIDFYKSSYGEIISEEMKRKRLTLKFLYQEKHIRVVISTQNNMQQVDVIVTK